MPRVSKVQSGKNRVAIEQAASRLFKSRGIHRVSVNEVMSAAGLTHGGFYGHFESKEELAAVACSRSFDESAQRWKGRVSEETSVAHARIRLLETYLASQPKIKENELICPMVGFISDVSREPKTASIRHSYAEGVKALANILSGTQPGKNKAEMRRRGLAELATLVGAVVLARALDGDSLGDEIIESTRLQLGLK